MEIIKEIKDNFLTKKIPVQSKYITIGLIFLVQIFTLLYLNNVFNFNSLMAASYHNVIINKEYYRLFTSLFIHADLAHLGGNLFLFIPFSYFLTGHFGNFFFPVLSLLFGSIINLIVLFFMPEYTELIGISGVVYWMGAAYLTLTFFIDRREKTSKRIIKISGIAIILFIPTVFSENVSYLSHLLGFLFGVVSAFIYYKFKEDYFKSKEKFIYKIEYDFPEEHYSDFIL